LVKQKVASKNIKPSLSEIRTITEDAISSITSDVWKKECEPVQKLEAEYREKDGLIEEEVARFVINLSEDSSSNSSESDSDMSGICPL
ncbi:hypothetical protein ANN_19077, partial [Periplaneta americana]